MDQPTIGRIVIYRDREGLDSPAMVTATHGSIVEARSLGTPVNDRVLKDVSSEFHLHLTVFTPRTTAETGTLRVADVAPADPDVDANLGTWRWPPRTAPSRHVELSPAQQLDIPRIAELVSRELATRLARA